MKTIAEINAIAMPILPNVVEKIKSFEPENKRHYVVVARARKIQGYKKHKGVVAVGSGSREVGQRRSNGSVIYLH